MLFLIFIIGFNDGFFRVIIVFLLIWFNVFFKLMVMVDFFFFVGVGLIDVMRINLFFGCVFKDWSVGKFIFVLYFL